MPITYKHDDIPDLWTFDLPMEEQGRAQELQSRLQEMAAISDEVASAVALFDFARQRVRDLEELLQTSPADRVASPQKREQESVTGWQLIAARTLVMAVWRFDAARAAASTLANAVPAIAALVDRDALKQSNRTFHEYFQAPAEPPDALAPRQHRALPAAARPVVRNDAEGTGASFEAELVESTITYLRDGRRRPLEVSQHTLRMLLCVRDQYFAAFGHVGQALQEKHWQETRWNAQRQFED